MAVLFVDAFEENILGFCNNIFTQEGGTHLVGFKTKFTQLINSYARELGILKEKDSNFTGADTRNGMTAVVAVKHPDPIFEGQTKTKLASADADQYVRATHIRILCQPGDVLIGCFLSVTDFPDDVQRTQRRS